MPALARVRSDLYRIALPLLPSDGPHGIEFDRAGLEAVHEG